MISLRKKNEVLVPYSVEQCPSCNALRKRKFVQGDYVFKDAGTCTSCKTGQVIISKIYGEVLK